MASPVGFPQDSRPTPLPSSSSIQALAQKVALPAAALFLILALIPHVSLFAAASTATALSALSVAYLHATSRPTPPPTPAAAAAEIRSSEEEVDEERVDPGMVEEIACMLREEELRRNDGGMQ
jgi:hypothetical protein